MSLPQRYSGDTRGVSPIIGIVLMVSITVILAAVIGTFVLGLGDYSNQPKATVDVTVSGSTDSTSRTVTYENKETQNASVHVKVRGPSPFNTVTLNNPGNSVQIDTSDSYTPTGTYLVIAIDTDGTAAVVAQFNLK